MSGITKPIHKLPGHEVPHEADAKMTGEQADKLRALCEEFNEEFDASLTQAQAEERIAELMKRKRAA